MINRVWFAITQAWSQRAALKRFLTEKDKQITALTEITASRLDEANIAILALDFDGVLAPYDALEPLPEVQKWLTQLSLEIGENRIVILTNKPQPERLRYFADRFPSIFIVQDVRKKPYPDGILQIVEYKGVPPHRVLLLDDRLLTGMLATCLSYCQGWYFCKPYQNFTLHPFKEAFFSLLRVCERWFLRFAA